MFVLLKQSLKWNFSLIIFFMTSQLCRWHSLVVVKPSTLPVVVIYKQQCSSGLQPIRESKFTAMLKSLIWGIPNITFTFLLLMAVKWAKWFPSHWKKSPKAVHHYPLPLALVERPWGTFALGGSTSDILRRKAWVAQAGPVQGARKTQEKLWNFWVRSRAQTWGRAETRHDYLLGPLCPLPSVRDICECCILFVPLMLTSKAHTVRLITGLKNVSCSSVITFYKFNLWL